MNPKKVYRRREAPFRDPSVCACGGHAFVGLTRGFVAIISPEDCSAVASYRWHVSGAPVPYARTVSKTGKTLYMHRLLVNAVGVVDHINGNGLDNRRSNLRECTQRQNTLNRKQCSKISQFKGIVKSPPHHWMARIRIDGRNVYLGRFASDDAAARAYDAAAVKHHGEFALTNKMMGLL